MYTLLIYTIIAGDVIMKMRTMKYVKGVRM